MTDIEQPNNIQNNITNQKCSNTINQTTNDKTFNRLRELQNLIKKESALKELCK